MESVEKTIDKLREYTNSSYFSDNLRNYSTSNQIRDHVIEFIYGRMTDLINEAKNLALVENDRRKLLNDFVKCSRCYGYHSGKENIDLLCEKCEQETATYRFDNKIE